MDKNIPNNIRQIGIPDKNYKIYIEDYVYTYVHNFLRQKYGSDTMRVAALLGEHTVIDDVHYLFLKGALSCEFNVFYDGISEDIRTQIRQTFPDTTIVGWYICCDNADVHVQSVLKHFLAQEEHLTQGESENIDIRQIEAGYPEEPVLLLEDLLEQDIHAMMWRQNTMNELNGYYIYYEKNPSMQEFLIQEKERLHLEKRLEPSCDSISDNQRERAYKKKESAYNQKESAYNQKESGYKKKLDRAKSEQTEDPKRRVKKIKRKKTPRILYAVCIAVLVVITATAITQMGNYNSLKKLQVAWQTFFPVANTEEQKSETSQQSEALQESETSQNAAVSQKSEASQEPQTSQNAAISQKSEASQEPETTQDAAVSQKSAASQKTETSQKSETSQNAETSQQSETPSSSLEQSSGTSLSKGKETVAASAAAGTDTAESTNTNKYLTQGYYIVQKGDSLLSISKKIYQKTNMTKQICEKNGLDDPNLIYEGQKLLLP